MERERETVKAAESLYGIYREEDGVYDGLAWLSTSYYSVIKQIYDRKVELLNICHIIKKIDEGHELQHLCLEYNNWAQVNVMLF